MIIGDKAKKIKEILRGSGIGDIAVVFIIVLVGVAGFGLGQLSVREGQKTPVKIVSPSDKTERDRVVASKAGSKYYLPWCAGAQNISEENRVWFESSGAAEKAGYTLAVNCK